MQIQFGLFAKQQNVLTLIPEQWKEQDEDGVDTIAQLTDSALVLAPDFDIQDRCVAFRNQFHTIACKQLLAQELLKLGNNLSFIVVAKAKALYFAVQG
jgi:hypothetical protein